MKIMLEHKKKPQTQKTNNMRQDDKQASSNPLVVIT